MSFNLRDALNGILMKGKYEVGPDYSQFAINAYLGKYKQYVPVLDKILSLNLPNQAHFDYLKKNCGFGWPSKLEITVHEEDPMIKYVMEYYECSRLDARDYLMFMTEQEKDSIKDYYDGDKEWLKYY